MTTKISQQCNAVVNVTRFTRAAALVYLGLPWSALFIFFLGRASGVVGTADLQQVRLAKLTTEGTQRTLLAIEKKPTRKD